MNGLYCTEGLIDPTVPHGYAEALRDIRRLCKRYPDLLCVEQCGRSLEGRYIPVLRLGCGRRYILAVAAMHAREFVTVGFLLKAIEDILCTGRGSGRLGGYDTKKLLREFSICSVVLANPDGVEISLGRQPSKFVGKESCLSFKNNAGNINLNANFPFEWSSVPRIRQGGRCAGSEPETQFLMRLCEQHRFELMLSFHSRGNCLYWRDSKNGTVPRDREIAENLRSVCGYELCPISVETEDFSGGFENWFRRRYGRVGVCVELVCDESADFFECCKHFYRLTNYRRTRLTLPAAADVLCDFQLFVA